MTIATATIDGRGLHRACATTPHSDASQSYLPMTINRRSLMGKSTSAIKESARPAKCSGSLNLSHKGEARNIFGRCRPKRKHLTEIIRIVVNHTISLRTKVDIELV
ncbi:hypothetical protein CPB85DRAFT_755493 [Mucidula mucida]|nr:hypothetical protein CPB85DRAFT_755493 [Mucidula mucida]